MLAHPVVSRVVITLARSPEPEVVINVTTIRVRSERPGTKQFQDTPSRRRFTVHRHNVTAQELKVNWEVIVTLMVAILRE